jgi:hypothetical protein
MLPIIAAGYLKCMSYLVKNTQRILTMLFFIFAFIFLYLTVITGSPESILAKRDALRGYDMIATWVTEHTSSDAVILTAKGDKYLWPNRLVITSFTNTKAFAAAGHYRAIEGRSIYYSGVTMDEVKYAAFNERLRQEGLELGDAIYTFRDVSIYPLELVEKNAT